MIRFLYLLCVTVLISCSSANIGYTNSNGYDYYLLITSNKKNLGNKRLTYNVSAHRTSQLDCFLKNNPKPEFILEYKDTLKREVIHLYYVHTDSVYIFKECFRNKPSCDSIETIRQLTKQEHRTYETLKKGTVKIKRSTY